ncbi:hypothetical protein [Draconibacterium sp.]|uniref:hypothetical protein n=1 Tax=Draconibacterium sp. TaxID=1965318 RepID=UPI0035654236
MEANSIAIGLMIVHMVYYLWFQVISDFQRIGMIHNTPHIEIERLRSKYNVNIKTFQKNTVHYGFAWFRTIYLNENLLRMKKRKQPDPFYLLKWSFHHEHYHLQHHHKRNVLLHRFAFSLLPLLIMIHWIPFVVVYVLAAYGMYYLKENVYERNANNYANEQMK